jgi:hypothetical protein
MSARRRDCVKLDREYSLQCERIIHSRHFQIENRVEKDIIVIIGNSLGDWTVALPSTKNIGAQNH